MFGAKIKDQFVIIPVINPYLNLVPLQRVRRQYILSMGIMEHTNGVPSIASCNRFLTKIKGVVMHLLPVQVHAS